MIREPRNGTLLPTLSPLLDQVIEAYRARKREEATQQRRPVKGQGKGRSGGGGSDLKSGGASSGGSATLTSLAALVRRDAGKALR